MTKPDLPQIRRPEGDESTSVDSTVSGSESTARFGQEPHRVLEAPNGAPKARSRQILGRQDSGETTAPEGGLSPIGQRLTVLPNGRTFEPLTQRQHTVLWLFAQGYAVTEIARAFRVQPTTIRSHLANAKRRLRGRTTLHTISLAFKHRYLF